MIRTPLCDLLDINVPIVQAGMGPFASAELAAAVSNAGGLGSLGAGTRSPDDLERELNRLSQATRRPFAVNHTLSNLNAAALDVTLRNRPKLVSFALGDPRDLVRRVHDVGSLAMLQVTTVRQARHAIEQGVDVIVAQGGEAGGFGGALSTLALVPQVVDAVHPIPVLAAGGIADGRGLAAALCLGAQGINIGTRFLASNESSIDRRWQQAILAAESEDATKVDAFNEFFAALSGEYGAVPRTMSSPFVRRLAERRQDVARDAERLRAEVMGAVEERRLYDLLPFAGETVGLIKEILPAADIVACIVAQAEQILETRRAQTSSEPD